MKSINNTNCLGRANRYLIIFGKPTRIVEPSQGTFNNPPLGQDLSFRLGIYSHSIAYRVYAYFHLPFQAQHSTTKGGEYPAEKEKFIKSYQSEAWTVLFCIDLIFIYYGQTPLFILAVLQIIYKSFHCKGRCIFVSNRKANITVCGNVQFLCILYGIDIRLAHGEIHGLIGRNGSGKSMLTKCICGFVIPSSGEVYVNGKHIGVDCDFPDDVGVIIESPGFIPYYSGSKNLKLLNGLDKKGVADMRKYLLDQKSNDKTILIASHSAEDIDVLCDHVY